MPITFRLKREPTVPLEAEVISPDVVADLSHAEIGALTVYHGKRQRPLSEFFDAMAEVVFDYGGTIDRLQADRIVGAWGATSSRSDDPDRALAAARDMIRTWSVDSGAPRYGMAIGIGMASGNALAHSTMIDGRPWLTLVGEPVTDATRLALRAGAFEILLASSLHSRMTNRPAGSRVPFARPRAVRVRNANGRAAG